MKILISIATIAVYLGAAELIYVSDNADDKSLDALYSKYKKEIILSDNRAYIVPSECLLVRHFGGVSQNSVEIVGKELQNGYLSMTQELFEAKDVDVVKLEIEKQKISDTIEAKEAKAFLQESNGHLFGGISQGVVDLDEQKKIVQEIDDKNKEKNKEIEHPVCKLLHDGSGYTISGAKNIKIYNGSNIVKVNEIILFQ